MSKFVTRRGDKFYYLRRVPAELRAHDPRPHIRISLKTRDEVEAGRLAAEHNKNVENYWRSLVRENKVHGADEAWQEAVALARLNGFTYKEVQEVAEGDLRDAYERLRVLEKKGMEPRLAKALLGGVERPLLRLTAALDIYFEQCQDRLAGKSGEFVKKWKRPRSRAINHFVEAEGDMAVTQIERRNILNFKDWWLKKILADNLDPGTANKDFMHLKDILQVTSIYKEMEIDTAALFVDIKLQGFNRSRDPFEAEFVRDNILKPGKLDALNDEARWIVQIMAETGAGPNEVLGLDPIKDIVLDAKIPYIHIRPNDTRDLKLPDRRDATRPRQIPLVGIALDAAKAVKAAGGFSRYDNADSASSAINKFMSENGMRQTERTTLYSLRHTFKDRLRDSGAPEEVIDNLMGHAGNRPKYGRGHALEMKLKWLKKISFKTS